MAEESNDQWLTLSEASSLLGVHASTLRRWADSGRVPCQRTPGGHRRFSRQRLRPLFEGSAFPAIREVDAAQARDQAWHAQFEGAGLVDTLRELGQRLSGILMQYLLRADADERFLDEGRALGRRYAEQSREAGIGLLDAARAFLFFRAGFADLVAQLPGADPATGLRLYGRYEQFTSEVLLGLIAGYVDDPRRNGHA
jgi:excisionase family DNA binding protein